MKLSFFNSVTTFIFVFISVSTSLSLNFNQRELDTASLDASLQPLFVDHSMHVSQTDLQIAQQLELEFTEFTEEQIREEVNKIWLLLQEDEFQNSCTKC